MTAIISVLSHSTASSAGTKLSDNGLNATTAPKIQEQGTGKGERGTDGCPLPLPSRATGSKSAFMPAGLRPARHEVWTEQRD